jgi:hypothetical protein
MGSVILLPLLMYHEVSFWLTGGWNTRFHDAGFNLASISMQECFASSPGDPWMFCVYALKELESPFGQWKGTEIFPRKDDDMMITKPVSFPSWWVDALQHGVWIKKGRLEPEQQMQEFCVTRKLNYATFSFYYSVPQTAFTERKLYVRDKNQTDSSVHWVMIRPGPKLN